MEKFIYKLLRCEEWENAKAAGVFAGSPDDLRDGYLHFSAAHQVRTTFDKYFSGGHNPVLAAVDPAILGAALKWEVSRGGDRFPHLYAALKLSDVHAVFEIGKDASGQPIFPPEIP
jgi:uncharacterized protein (DUF952 family)